MGKSMAILYNILNCVWVILITYFKTTIIYNNAYKLKVMMYSYNKHTHNNAHKISVDMTIFIS